MSENILIAYYSWSGNTRKVAEQIYKRTGGTIFEIAPRTPYPANYNEVVNQAKKEIRDGFKPELKSSIGDIDAYGRIFIGSPNWWHTIAPPVATFLADLNFKGKQVFPFCTHGGGGQGRIVKAINELCPDSTVKAGFGIYNSGGRETMSQIDSWLSSAGWRS